MDESHSKQARQSTRRFCAPTHPSCNNKEEEEEEEGTGC
jgi:hypothetical protein